MRGKQRLRGRRPNLQRAAVVFVAVAALLSLVGLYISRTLRIADLRAELAALGAAEAQAEIHQDALRAQLLTVNDSEVVETAARSLLGLVYPGEEKVIFVYEE